VAKEWIFDRWWDFLVISFTRMTKHEIKSEIQKSLDNVPETVLHEVLNFLKQAQANPNKPIKLAQNLSKILNEDKGLLERLAK
jgi:hypothetical protein